MARDGSACQGMIVCEKINDALASVKALEDGMTEYLDEDRDHYFNPPASTSMTYAMKPMQALSTLKVLKVRKTVKMDAMTVHESAKGSE